MDTEETILTVTEASRIIPEKGDHTDIKKIRGAISSIRPVFRMIDGEYGECPYCHTFYNKYYGKHLFDDDDIPAIKPIVDRFDLMFVFKTSKDPIDLREYTYKKSKSERSKIPNYDEFIMKYLIYAKRFNPSISDEAETIQDESSITSKTSNSQGVKSEVNKDPRMDDRKAMSAIFYVLRTGCQWKALPRSLGASSTVHDRFQEWRKEGVFKRMWIDGLSVYDENNSIDWKWQAMDGVITKAPLGGKKHGTKSHRQK